MSVPEVAVMASSGRTGSTCITYLLEKGYKVRAVSRSGIVREEFKDNENVLPFAGDVTKPETLQACIEGTLAVIFAASASAGWRFPNEAKNTPPAVDFQGCKNVAEACCQYNVPQYIIVSSACVTRSMFSSLPYALLNSFFGRIMHWKLQGEQSAMEIINKREELSFTIVRPGGLSDEPLAEPTALRLVTGDNQSGRISRKSVGKIVAECVGNEKAKNIAFECIGGENTNVASYSELFEQLPSIN